MEYMGDGTLNNSEIIQVPVNHLQSIGLYKVIANIVSEYLNNAIESLFVNYHNLLM